MKKGLLSKIMAIIGSLVTIYFGYTYYTVVAGIWEPLNKDGAPVGSTIYLVCTLIFAAIAAVGIVLWTKASKEKKA